MKLRLFGEFIIKLLSVGFMELGMALRPLFSKQNLPYHSPTGTSHPKPSFQSKEMPQKVLQHKMSRRIGLVAVASIFVTSESILGQETANGLDLRMIVPEQTIEEAVHEIKGHAQSVLEVKALLESESWREAQKALRKSSSDLKQDIYTIIQSKPGSERLQLRKLYFNLFNNVTKLDYAARDKDGSRVWQCYENIVAALEDILSRM